MTEFGPYEVMSEVASGATGRVFRARHRELGREAAIKELGDWVRAAPGAVEGLRSEAGVLAQLDHPNVVALYDYVEEADRAWLAEQWVDGVSLRDLLNQHGRLTPQQALGVVHGALSGLAYAHSRGVVHRDVSIGNVLADMAGTSMLVDFGLAAPAGAGSALGTPASISPEAARGEPVGRPGDVYSAAAVLYELLTGAPVFVGNAVQVVTAHRDRPAPPMATHGPALADLVARSLSKDPAQRPPDGGAFLAELEQAAERTYGADWRRQASIAGLVSATLAAGAATLGAGGAGGAAAPTVVFPGAGTPASVGAATGAVSESTGRSSGLLWGVVGAGAAVLVAAAVAVALVARDGGDGDDDPAASSLEQVVEGDEDDPEPSEEPEPTPEETQPVGRYQGPIKFIRIVPGNGAVDASVRQRESREWTFAPSACTDKACRGSLTSSTGESYDYTWNGKRLRIPAETDPISVGCSTTDGQPAPGTLRARLKTSIDATGVVGNTGVRQIKVEFTTTVLSYQDDTANNCTWNRPVPKFWIKGGTLRKAG